ncbi:Hyphally-regulated cell wall protein, partial [Scheffersomyces xylosifermentans]|uniref:Hyphally-regulated cell wall protein n=1 Tax=Scheffersomyces xylosifermentans TaxID=1304137 RepID=UPI00315C5D71
IFLYQYNSRRGGTSRLGRDGSTITNDGTVCLFQNNYDQNSIVEGDGSWDVGYDSNFEASNLNTIPIQEGQLIYLSTPSSSLRIDTNNQNVPLHVAGWGNNNVIGLMSQIDSFSYDGEILSIISGLIHIKLTLGRDMILR